MPFAPYSDVDMDTVRPYYKKPEYVEGAPPLFGISFAAVVKGDVIAMYIPTQTTYYFRAEADIPIPHEDWYVWSEAYGEEWGYIEEEAPTWWTSWTREYMWKFGAIEAGFALSFLGIQVGLDEKIASALGGVKDRIEKVWAATEGIRKTIGARIESARALYGKVAEFIHLEQLRTIDHILSLTWQDYYNKKLQIMGKMGAISQELFGNVHVLNQWLGLAGMIWKDYAAARGKTWGEQDMEWFAKTNDFMTGIEDKLGYYARYPERLWIKIEDALVRPIYEARGEAYTGWDDDRAALRGWIGTLEKFYKTLDRKVLEYQLALPDNIRDEMGPDLIKFRKDLREVWKGDLVPIISYLEERLDLNDSQWLGYDRWKSLADPKIGQAATLLSSPTVLTPEDRSFQADRFSEIQEAMVTDFESFALPLLEMEVPLFGKAVREVLERRE